MKPVDIFFVRRFNDIDHIVPVVYRMAKEGQRTPVVLCLNPFVEIEKDFRLKFLREQWAVTVTYVYAWYTPTVFHKAMARVLCSSYLRGSLKDLVRSAGLQERGGRNSGRTLIGLKKVLIGMMYGVFKKYLYNWTDRVLVRKYLFNTRWAEGFLRATGAASLIFDYIHEDIHIAGSVIAAARTLGVPTISLPHGTSLFSDRPVEGPADNHARVISSGVDYFVVHHHRDAQVLKGYGFDARKLRVLGSARYCREWEEVLHRIVPPEETPCSNGRERKLKVVYMERGADRHGAYKHLVWETLERIAALDFVDFIIKPPTRTDRVHFSKLPQSVVIANDINSVNLCKWADVVVGTVTSILLEVFWQHKILLYPKYFHEDLMWFEEMGACWTVNSPEELERALRRLTTTPSYRPYPQSAVEAFLGHIVYAGESDRDVLGRYTRFIARVAANGVVRHPGVSRVRRLPDSGHAPIPPEAPPGGTHRTAGRSGGAVAGDTSPPVEGVRRDPWSPS